MACVFCYMPYVFPRMTKHGGKKGILMFLNRARNFTTEIKHGWILKFFICELRKISKLLKGVLYFY